MSETRLIELSLYVGQRPLRAGRVALAVILWQSDFGAYAALGHSITGATYRKAMVPGEPWPRSVWQGFSDGLRWGAIEYRLREGTLRRRDAEWIGRKWWKAGVPV